MSVWVGHRTLDDANSTADVVQLAGYIGTRVMSEFGVQL